MRTADQLPRLYIAGPMTGLPEFNYPAFHQAAEILRAAGYKVTNPAENCLPSDEPWRNHTRVAIARMMACDAIALLPGWESSRGAGLEVLAGQRLEYEIRTVFTWLDEVQAVAP